MHIELQCFNGALEHIIAEGNVNVRKLVSIENRQTLTREGEKEKKKNHIKIWKQKVALFSAILGSENF